MDCHDKGSGELGRTTVTENIQVAHQNHLETHLNFFKLLVPQFNVLFFTRKLKTVNNIISVYHY